MITALFPFVFAAATYLVARHSLEPSKENARFARWILAGFVMRLVAHFAIRNVVLFSNGTSSGDAMGYEYGGWMLARLWDYRGIGLYSYQELGVSSGSNALLAIHLFGLVTYLNGIVPSSLACTAIVAFLAAATCVQLVKLGQLIGGSEGDSRFVALVMYFSPAFVFHTAEMFKDGIVAFLVVTAVFISFRLAARFSWADAMGGIVCIVLLWFVRYYLVFIVSAPLVASLLGVRSGSPTRVIAAAMFMAVIGLIIMNTQAAEVALDAGTRAYARGTAETSMASNARGGSGVTFTGSPWVTFPQRVAYTLLSPFPWDFRSSSIGFQIGKIDVLVWSFFAYRALRGVRRMWSDDRGTLLMFLVVLVPLVVAYAASMANIGLIVRQRIPIVLLGSVLAVRGVPEPKAHRAGPPTTVPARWAARTA